MKKSINFILVLSLLFAGCLGYVGYQKEYKESSVLSYSANNSINVEEENNKILENVKKLQGYADEYIESSGVTTTKTELCLQYIRKDTYNSGLWVTLLGAIDSNFVTYVEEKDDTLTFIDTILYDVRTGKETDFVHMVGALNAYYKYGTEPVMFSTDYAGWAGDLLTLMEEMISYRTLNSVTDVNLLRQYVNERLATNNSSSFSSADAYADLDAINIYNIDTLNTDLYNTLKNYYTKTNTGNNAYNRLTAVRDFIGTKESLKVKTIELLGDSTVNGQLIPGSAALVTDGDKEIMATEFSEYIYGKTYGNINETTDSLKINDTKEYNLIEKNIVESNALEYNDKLVKVRVYNNKMYVTGLNYGEATIEIKNGDTVVDSIKVFVSNIAPKINGEINIKEELIFNTDNIVSIDALGTNNIYTWYISDTLGGTYTKIDEVTTPTYKLKPTMDMNGKYLKCGVKNAGNEEVFSNAVKLKVVDKGIVNTGDTTLIIAGLLIFVVVISNIVVNKKVTRLNG